jgi:hypothetical protein
MKTILALALLLFVPAAHAATPVYNDPPSYEGRDTAPKTKQAPDPPAPAPRRVARMTAQRTPSSTAG